MASAVLPGTGPWVPRKVGSAGAVRWAVVRYNGGIPCYWHSVPNKFGGRRDVRFRSESAAQACADKLNKGIPTDGNPIVQLVNDYNAAASEQHHD